MSAHVWTPIPSKKAAKPAGRVSRRSKTSGSRPWARGGCRVCRGAGSDVLVRLDELAVICPEAGDRDLGLLGLAVGLDCTAVPFGPRDAMVGAQGTHTMLLVTRGAEGGELNGVAQAFLAGVAPFTPGSGPRATRETRLQVSPATEAGQAECCSRRPIAKAKVTRQSSRARHFQPPTCQIHQPFQVGSSDSRHEAEQKDLTKSNLESKVATRLILDNQQCFMVQGGPYPTIHSPLQTKNFKQGNSYEIWHFQTGNFI